MKRIFCLGLMLSVLGGTVIAQETVTPQNGEVRKISSEDMKKAVTKIAANRTKAMVKDYGLNDEQKKAVEALNLEYAEKGLFREAGNRRPGGNNGGGGHQNGDFKMPVGAGESDSDSGNSASPRPRMNREEREKMREQRKANMETYETALKKIFTEAQFQSYLDKKADAVKKMQRRERAGANMN